jgi:eukaryotic-like serine/threonine-protein kinase
MQDGSPHSASTQLSPGTRLNGIYEIDHLIAAGGMGEVYKGHTVQTGDTVAIKVLHPEYARNEAALGLFRREASALHNMHHEAIVRYYVFTIEPTLGRPYLAMEFVEGQSLADLVRREPLTYEAVRALLKRVAAGLHAAHERGIIHRDVSSDNIMIPGGDVARAKIIDFGIARSTQLSDRTIIGSGFAGKYNYVSPEQLGLFGGDVQAKSDIYSLGLVLIEALNGQPIDMGGSQAAILEKRRKVPDLGAIDLRVRPLIARMLEPDPAARPESMAHVATWPLPTSRPNDDRYASNLGRSAERPHASTRRAGTKWMALAATLAVISIGGAGAAYYLLGPGAPGVKEPPPPPLLGAGKASPPSDSSTVAAARPPQPAGPTLTPSTPPPTSSAQSPSTTAQPPPSSPLPAAPAPFVLTPAQPSPTQDNAPASKAAPKEMAALPPPVVGRAEQITRYINSYDGGDCFFITPNSVSASAARIDGYGASAAPFQRLDGAFKSAHGFEADIDVRQVTSAQCPALSFVSRLRQQRDRAPKLQIGEASLRSGQALTGTVQVGGNRSVQLLLVSEEGAVQDLSGLLKRAGDGYTFNLRMQRTGASGAQPQLLLAVSGERPLETIKGAQSTAEQLFPLAGVEVARTGQAVGATIRYFKLDL